MKYRTFRAYIWEEIKKHDMFKEIVESNKERINDYFNVMVFNKFEDMYEMVDKIEENTEGNYEKGIEHDYEARTLVCRQQLYYEGEEEIWGYSKAQGFIFLCDEQGITFRTISHEVGHAVLGYMGAYFKDKFKIGDYNDRNVPENILYEELFCYMTGTLNNEICIKF